MAALIDLCSNHCKSGFTPEELQKMATPGARADGLSRPARYQAHELSKRLGPDVVRDLVTRAKAGESARALARDMQVAPSAMTRLLREQGVTVSKRKVTNKEAAEMKREYEAGVTMAQLEAKYSLSHGAVYRALHRARNTG